MLKARRSTYKSDPSEETTINLTPLIDVVFVVLIIFILIAPMLELDRVQLATATQQDTKEKATIQENSPLAIHVYADNSVWFNNKVISTQELLPTLKEAKRLYPQKIPQLFHDRKAPFGTYQTIKGALEAAGFEQLDVILQPQ